MATEFFIGVIIGGAISGAFRSAVTGTRRTLDSIGETTRRLQERQNALTRATERYGQLGSRASQRLNSDLQRVGRTMEQLQRQQNRLAAAAATSDAARTNRMALNAVKDAFPDAVRLARDTGQAATFIVSARQSLADVDSRNLAAALNTVSGQFDAAGVLLKNSSPALSKMTSAIVARKA
ncbi:hypothetical protein CS369_08450 [Candidatus Symbiopectobacterium sp. 'North America']|nr:hypothetical protein [Candidatus Symbiopectobacterium sp. 'North America']